MIIRKINYQFGDISPTGTIFKKAGVLYMKISKEVGGYNAIRLEDGEPVSVDNEAEISMPEYNFEVVR